ncbi:unnamed protein product [Tilletia controversa]|uniref:Cytochrome c oxidase assembly protein COX19 n=3 Tax=Tilletia TaxID=13289 RepID=A0A8X7MXK9_9BASI|nr:hypothetical protein CF336_g3433 [Tilletia laevis]KAE8203885.1 hypothetical protein CF328_g1394 [Tilletia controversa]KAE8262198.1 hypothetical protein A4X03_0g2645 [Tilletia caries]KAE8204760.1 hypothetical protein CF335_g2534 [Tilletia laevis]KAE8252885.1 hypothetical protein A4X06_0g1851 [Tilletia controversa]
MSFGRPPSFGSLTNVTLAPPEYGSFPIDHDGECKDAMKAYMACLKANRMDNGQCRSLSKQYLECRMAKGLMEKHDLGDLGYRDIVDSSTATPPSSTPTASNAFPSSAPVASSQQRLV